jgi:hypothetical protein
LRRYFSNKASVFYLCRIAEGGRKVCHAVRDLHSARYIISNDFYTIVLYAVFTSCLKARTLIARLSLHSDTHNSHPRQGGRGGGGEFFRVCVVRAQIRASCFGNCTRTSECGPRRNKRVVESVRIVCQERILVTPVFTSATLFVTIVLARVP